MELARWKQRLALPLVIEPQNFPAKTPLSAHLVTAARLAGGDAVLLSTLIRKSLGAGCLDRRRKSVLAACCEKAGLDGPSLIEAAKSEETRAVFAEDTELALHRSVFGAPSYMIDGELFWGQDRLDFVAEKLGAV